MRFTWDNINIKDSKTNSPLKYKTTTTPVPEKPIEFTPKYSEPIPSYQQGWVCPKCGKVLAPWVSSCFCSYRGLSITYNIIN